MPPCYALMPASKDLKHPAEAPRALLFKVEVQLAGIVADTVYFATRAEAEAYVRSFDAASPTDVIDKRKPIRRKPKR